MNEKSMKELEMFPDLPEGDVEVQAILKAVFVGDSGVGKTNLLHRLTKDQCSPESKPTIGIDFFNKTIKLRGEFLRIQIWDTAGQERYKSFVSAYFKDCHGVFLVYDITSKESFLNVVRWIELIQSHTKNGEVTIIIVGNKSDLESKREVSLEEGKDFAKKHQLRFIETSALFNNDRNVFRALKLLVDDILATAPIAVGLTDSDSKRKLGITPHFSEGQTKKPFMGCC